MTNMIKGKSGKYPEGAMLTKEDYIEKEEVCDGCGKSFLVSQLKKDGSDKFCPDCVRANELEEVEFLIDQNV